MPLWFVVCLLASCSVVTGAVPERIYPDSMRANIQNSLGDYPASLWARQQYLYSLIDHLLAIPDSAFSLGSALKLKRVANHIDEILPMEDFPKDRPLPESEAHIETTWGFPNPPHITLYLKFFPKENEFNSASTIEQETFLLSVWAALIKVFTYSHPIFDRKWHNSLSETGVRDFCASFFTDLWHSASRRNLGSNALDFAKLVADKLSEFATRFKELDKNPAFDPRNIDNDFKTYVQTITIQLGIGILIL